MTVQTDLLHFEEPLTVAKYISQVISTYVCIYETVPIVHDWSVLIESL